MGHRSAKFILRHRTAILLCRWCSLSFEILNALTTQINDVFGIVVVIGYNNKKRSHPFGGATFSRSVGYAITFQASF